MKLPLLAQLAQVALGLGGLGAVLGLAFDVLRVPRRHARRAIFARCSTARFAWRSGAVFLLGMAAGRRQVRLFLFAAIAGGWTGYFLWLSGHIFPPLERSGRLCARKMRQITAPLEENS